MAQVMATCPTCGASGYDPCVRGRKPVDRGGVFGAVWNKGETLTRNGVPVYHDSRVSASRDNN